VQRSQTIICGGVAIVLAFATPALSAPTPSKSVETETIIVPSEDIGPDDEGLIPSDLPEFEEDDTGTIDPGDRSGSSTGAEALPPIEYDVDKLPAPVRRLREQITEAALSGDIDRLGPIFEANGEPVVSFGGAENPIDYLKSISGDPEGREILAILLEVLEQGFVHIDVGSPDEMYVWPYFARYPPEGLSGPQMVELFTLLTAGDYEDMKIFGTYQFYRVGISPDGTWRYFVAGD
jgi:hypothetical protein